MKRLALLILLPASVVAAELPTADFLPSSDTVMLHRLPDIFDHEVVSTELDSGLTNTFIVRTVLRRPGRPKIRGGSLISIRYDLWDEAYRVSWTGGDGATRRFIAENRASLRHWWNEVSLPVVADAEIRPGEDARLKVEFAFVPFSQAETDETRRWLEGKAPSSVDSSPGTTNPGGVNRAATSYGAVLDVLVATSLRPETLLSFNWTIPVTTEADHASENPSRAADGDDSGDGHRLPPVPGPSEPEPGGGGNPPGGDLPA